MINENQELEKYSLEQNDESIPEVDIKKAVVIRRQFFSHMKDMMVTFRPNGVQFNTSCISFFTDVTHVFLLIDWGQNWFIIKPCQPNDRDGQRWCNIKDGIRKPRLISGKDFAERLYKKMEWCKGSCYKVCGTLAKQIDTDDELILVFELKDAEEYPMTRKSRKTAGVDDAEISQDDLAKLDEFEKQKELEKQERKLAKAEGRETRKTRRKSHFPKCWDDSFGVAYEQHTPRIEFPHLPGTGDEARRSGMSLFKEDEERTHYDE